jgi:hypothetical protein
MRCIWGMTMIVLDALIEKLVEFGISIVGSSINTDTRVGPLGSREDSLLEGESIFISSVFACFPDIWGEALGEE